MDRISIQNIELRIGISHERVVLTGAPLNQPNIHNRPILKIDSR